MTESNSRIRKYVHQIIFGFESGLYKVLQEENTGRISMLSDNKQPFISIFRDLHEEYYTKVYNSMVEKDDLFISQMFNEFNVFIPGHSNKCILTVLANLAISVHFNLNRKKLDFSDHDSYMNSVTKQINSTIDTVNIHNLFSHNCRNTELNKLSKGEKFLTIKLSRELDGNVEEIKSF